MKRLLLILLCLILIFALTACKDKSKTNTQETTAPTQAPTQEPEQPIYIDVDSLNAIEASDDFSVKIESKQYLTEGDPVTSAKIQLDVDNYTGSTLKELYILYVCTDGSGALCFVNGYELVTFDGTGVSTEGTCAHLEFVDNVNLDTPLVINMVMSDDIAKAKTVNAIVYSYVDEYGNEVINENANAWLEITKML